MKVRSLRCQKMCTPISMSTSLLFFMIVTIIIIMNQGVTLSSNLLCITTIRMHVTLLDIDWGEGCPDHINIHVIQLSRWVNCIDWSLLFSRKIKHLHYVHFFSCFQERNVLMLQHMSYSLCSWAIMASVFLLPTFQPKKPTLLQFTSTFGKQSGG